VAYSITMLGASTAIVKLPGTLGFTERVGLDIVLAPAWYFCSTQDRCAYLNCRSWVNPSDGELFSRNAPTMECVAWSTTRLRNIGTFGGAESPPAKNIPSRLCQKPHQPCRRIVPQQYDPASSYDRADVWRNRVEARESGWTLLRFGRMVERE
jgi:hypothetical protein